MSNERTITLEWSPAIVICAFLYITDQILCLNS